MQEAENIGLIKIDALGLKTLSVIQDTLKIIEERTGDKIDLHKIDMEDKKVYAMLSDGLTKGVFQCEATPYTNLLVKMGVKSFAELAASNALVRPGAMNTIGKDYIARKHGKQNIAYHHQVMKSFTSDTYGCILYQEQVMLACTELGGMTMAEADKVRKIIGKKKDAKEFDQFQDMADQMVPLSPLPESVKKELLSDIKNWLGTLKKLLPQPGASMGYSYLTPRGFELGARWRETREVLGHLDTAEMEVTAFERNRSYTITHHKAGVRIDTSHIDTAVKH